MMMPWAVPSSAVITDSQRMVVRTWLREPPTARISPSSRVRS